MKYCISFMFERTYVDVVYLNLEKRLQLCVCVIKDTSRCI